MSSTLSDPVRGAHGDPGAIAGHAALWVLLTGTFMTVLDFFIVAVALPSIERDLQAGPAQLQWVVAAYGLAFASLLITCGRLGDACGRRRLYAIGLALFVLASIACGLAPSPGVLIGARALQGAGSALISPQVLGMLNTLFVAQARARAFATYGLVLGLAAAFGQLIGGLLIAWNPLELGWRSCFLINPLLAAPALLALRRALPAAAPSGNARIDLVGIALLVTGLAALVSSLIEGRGRTIEPAAWYQAASAVLLLGLFALQQRRLTRRGGVPLVPAELLRNRRFLLAVGAALAFYMTNASLYFVIALYSQHGRGLDALASSLLFSALAAGFFVATRVTGGRAAGGDGRAIEHGALLLMITHAAGWLLLRSLEALVPLILLVPLLVLQGVAIGLVMAPLTAFALAGVPAAHAGVAAGVFATMQWLGNSLGIGIVGIPLFATLEQRTRYAATMVAGALDWQHATSAALGSLALLVAVFYLMLRLGRVRIT